MKKYSGITKIGYYDSGVKWLSGKVSSDASLEPEMIRTEHTTGALFSGSSLSGTMTILSMEDWELLKKKMEDSDEHIWLFEYQDGRVMVSHYVLNIFVTKGSEPNSRDGISGLVLSFEHYDSLASLIDIGEYPTDNMIAYTAEAFENRLKFNDLDSFAEFANQFE